MKLKNSVFICILFFISIVPAVAIPDEIITDVIIVIDGDKILAFSGKNNDWVPHSLKLKEKVILKEAHGNVGVVITNERLFGFSAISGKWSIVELLINEKIKDLQAEGNVATVATDQRIFGFNAHTGLWSEFN